MKRIVVIEDEPVIRTFIGDFLKKNTFDVKVFDTGSTALDFLSQYLPDLIILDLGLPDVEGVWVLQEIRKRYDVPVIILTANNSVDYICDTLHIGADDYLTKPFSTKELFARIVARLRSKPVHATLMIEGDLSINIKTQEVWVRDRPIRLSRTEFDLLVFLLNHKGIVLSREQLLSEIWGNCVGNDTRVVDVYISYLRRKINRNDPVLIIETRRGVGYYVSSQVVELS